MKKSVDVLVEERAWPVEELAARSGLEVDRVEAIVDGRWLPCPEERQQIAQAFEREVDQIYWGHTLNPRNIRYRRIGP